MNLNSKSFEIKRLTNADLATFNLLIELFNTVFEEESNMGSEANSLRLLNNNQFIAIAALAENEVVG